MDISLALRHAAARLTTEGPGAMLHWIVRRFQWRWLERHYRIRTEGIVPMSELGIDNPDSGEYMPTDYADFGRIMRGLQLEPSEYVFIDFGAGMGRVMILAATLPFRRVLGVEHSPALVEIAARNIERSRPRLKCQALEITTGDAARFQLPCESLVLFFNNPFHGQALEAVLGNIREISETASRAIWLVCNVPATSLFENQLRDQAWLDLKDEFPLAELRRGLIFQTRPASAPRQPRLES